MTSQPSVGPTTSSTTALSTADPTNPRRDLVVVRIRDAAYFGATNSWDLFVITGTPAASPVDPTIPSDGSYLLLARVAVAAGATSITNANITDLRAFVFSGVQSRRYTTPGGTTSGTAVLTLFTIALPAQGLPFVAKFDFAAIFTQSVATDAFDMVASNNLDAQARHFRPFRSTTGNFTALGAGLFEFSGASPVTLSFTIARNSGSGTATVNADGRFSFVDLLVLKPARSI
jgi:hypothetical protein